jgi:hypothetical protein
VKVGILSKKEKAMEERRKDKQFDKDKQISNDKLEDYPRRWAAVYIDGRRSCFRGHLLRSIPHNPITPDPGSTKNE